MTDPNAATLTHVTKDDAAAASTPGPHPMTGRNVSSEGIDVRFSSSELLCEGAIVREKYRLARRLGKGGMGEVWLATHLELKTDVAIKFVHEILANEASHGGTALERFRFEAQIAARLAVGTRHVVGVHDTGEFGGCPFLVMEYVPGRTLEDELERGGRLDPWRFASILDQIADAVDAAHAQGIVHRDLKPPNVLLVDQRDGSVLVKVADFGVAKALRENVAMDKPKETVAGLLVGSPAYMSPEQIGGDEIGPRTDLWALGAVAFEVLTGRSCFSGDTLRELMMAIMSGPTPSISAIRPDLPVDVDRWLEKALAKKAADRFASASEMARAYRDALKPRGALKAPGRRLVVVAALGALGVVAVVVLIVILASRGEAPRKPEASAPITPAPLDNPAAIAADSPRAPAIVSPVDTAAHGSAPARSPTPSPLSRTQDPSAAASAPPATPPTAEPTVSAIVAAPAPPSTTTTAPKEAPSAEPTAPPSRPVKKIDPSEIQ